MPATEAEQSIEIEQKQEEFRLQSMYQPRSKGTAIGTLAPVGIAAGMALSLDRVEQVTGLDIDTYVAAKLGCTYETLFERYAAEQIDTNAISFLNEELGLQSTITHDTGIGKGRIVSALIQRAIAPIEMPDLIGKNQEEQQDILAGLEAEVGASAAQGRIAVFVTAKPDLYVDMLSRDMVDTGVASLVRPFFTNSGLDVELKSPDGTVTGQIRTPGTAAQNREMESLIEQFQTTGTVGQYNVVFTTYDQLKDKNSVRRRFFEEIAPATTFVLDECDLAGGASGPTQELTFKEKLAKAQGLDIRSVSEYVCKSLMPKAKAYVNLSATAAKDPYVLSRLIYSQSDIQNIGLGAEALAKTLSDQGVPSQQDAANRLAAGGELQRLEKDMSGIEFGTTQIAVDLQLFDQAVKTMQRVVDFDRLKQEAVEDIKEGLYAQAKSLRSVDPSAGEASISSTAFTSSAYNLTQQLLFSLKANSIADDAIAVIENGQKPKIDFYNTMQSMLESYLDDRKDEFYQVVIDRLREEEFDKIVAAFPESSKNELEKAFLDQFAGKIKKEGDAAYREWFATNPEINMNFGDLLIRQMERCRMVTIGDPYGQKTRYRLTDEELGHEAIELFEAVTQEIRAANWSGLPISPVDAILHKVESAGYVMGEMSGRSLGLDYSTAAPTLRSLDAADPKARSDVKSGYNNGSVDAIITNITTGWSAHAQVGKVKDLRQRVNIVAQPHSNPNMLVQSLGRVNRTGQLDPSKIAPERLDDGQPVWGEVTERYGIKGKFGLPTVKIMQAEGVPYERRVIANINRKFASLNANTTGNRRAGTDFGGVDFNNAIGDRIVEGILEDFPRLDKALDYPLLKMETLAGAANKVTGRSIFLGLADQELLMDLIETRFTEEILQLEALGESPLEQKTFDLQSTTLERMKLMEAKSDGIFGGAVYVEKMRVRALRKPFTGEQVAEKVQQYAELETFNDVSVGSKDLRENSNLRQAADEKMQEQLEGIGIRISSILEAQETEIAQLQEATEDSAFVAASAKTAKESVESLKAELVALKNEVKELSSKDSPLSKEEKAVEKDRLKLVVTEKQSEYEIQSALYKNLATQVAKLSGLTQQQQKLVETGRKLKGGLESVRAKLSLCTPGQPLSLSTGEGLLYGIVTDVQRVEAVQNPLSGGAWKVKIAIADASREITLKLSDITLNSIETGKKQIKIQAADNQCYMFMPGNLLKGEVRELLEALQKESYEIRQIATGELLSSPVKGKFLKFTTAEGQIRQGILLPRGVDMEKEVARQAVPVQVDQVQTLLDRNVPIETLKGLSLTASSRRRNGRIEDGVFLEVKATKGEGGGYFTNKDLIALTMNSEGEPGFEQKGGGKNKVMRGFVPDSEVPALLQWLTNQKENLEVVKLDQLPLARLLVGQKAQKFEEVTSAPIASETDLDTTEFQIPVEKLRDRIAQVKVQRDVQDSLRIETMRVALESQVNDESVIDEAFSWEELQQFRIEEIPTAQAEPGVNITADIAIAGLTEAYRKNFTEGNTFSNISQARKFAANYFAEQEGSAELTNKTIEECIEKGVVLASADIARSGGDRLASFDSLVELYQAMPRLQTRTSNSVILQQYSTPVPLGLLAQQLAGVDSETIVYEPTIGNGSLVTNANPKNVEANEIDPKRATFARSQGYGVSQQDATEYTPPRKVDVVIANPPFGKTEDLKGNTKKFLIDLPNPAEGTRAYATPKMDHAISFKALTALKEDGKAVLILGAPMEQKTGAKPSDAYNGPDNRAFYHTLYNNYKVTQHFTVSGDLYAKQGTSFPVDVVVIEGRGRSELPLPAAQNPVVYRTWESLREVMKESIDQGLEQRESLEALLDDKSRFTVEREGFAPVDIYKIEDGSGYGASFKPTPDSSPITSFQGISKADAIEWANNTLNVAEISESYKKQAQTVGEDVSMAEIEVGDQPTEIRFDLSTLPDVQRMAVQRILDTAATIPHCEVQDVVFQDGDVQINTLMDGVRKVSPIVLMNGETVPMPIAGQINALVGHSLKKEAEITPRPLVDEKVIDGITFQFAPLIQSDSEIKNPVEAVNPKNLKQKDLETLEKTGLTPAAYQTGKSERNVANLLHRSGIAAAGLMSGEDFSIKIENEPYTPLSIERHDNQLYLTHYQEIQGDLILDAEMVFSVTDGDLKLTETAVQNPIRGGESRGCDRKFAEGFSKNILDQGFVKAAQKTLATQSVEALPVEPVVETKITEPKPVVVAQPKTTVAPTVEVANDRANKLYGRINKLDSGDFSKQDVGDALKLLSANTGLALGQQYLRELDKMSDAVLLAETMDRAQSIREGVTLRDITRARDATNASALRNAQKVAAPSPAVSPMEATRQVIAKHDPETLKVMQQADPQACSPSLRELRSWLADAKILGRDAGYQDRIKAIANDLLANTPEQIKPASERNPDYQNPNFSLSGKASAAMTRDSVAARDVEIAQIGAKILAKVGKPAEGKIAFENQKGNYKLEFDPKTKTLNIWAKDREGSLVLSQVDGKIQSGNSQTTDKDRQNFKTFIVAVEKIETAKKQSSVAR